MVEAKNSKKVYVARQQRRSIMVTDLEAHRQMKAKAALEGKTVTELFNKWMREYVGQ